MGPPRLPTSLDEVERALQDANVAPLATEVGMSVAAGYASGLALRFVGRALSGGRGETGRSAAAVAVGGAFVFVQSLAYSGYVSVDWAKVEREYRHLLDLDGDGKVTTNDVRLMTDKLQSVLLFNLPSGAGFTGGLYYGLGGTAAGAGKLGASLGFGGLAARGLVVTAAPAALSVAAEVDDVRERLERARQWGEGEYSKLIVHEDSAKAMATLNRLTLGLVPLLQPSPEARLRAFESSLDGKDLTALRELEQQLRRLRRQRPADPELPMQLHLVQLRQRALKPRRRGWFY